MCAAHYVREFVLTVNWELLGHGEDPDNKEEVNRIASVDLHTLFIYFKLKSESLSTSLLEFLTLI